MTKSAAEILHSENYADRVIRVRRTDIDPDPKQPRSAPDADLRASIEANGIQQPIVLRPHPDKRGKFMLVDGERRWRGSEGVLDELPARIDDRELSRADLLIIQATFNQGKPLPPFDEAVLFAALSKHGLSDQEIARRLGKPRSTVGDRRRMQDLPGPWLALIREGKLGVSHAAIIQRYTPIPAKHHHVIANKTVAALNRDRVRGEEPTLREFEGAIRGAVHDYVKALDDYYMRDAKYEGPVLEYPPWPGMPATKCAADPEIWKPIVEAAQKKERSRTDSFNSAAANERYAAERRRQDKALKKKNALRRAQYSAIAAKVPTTLDERWSLFAIEYLLDEMHNDAQRTACKVLGLTVKKEKGPYGSTSYGYDTALIEHAKTLNVFGRTQLLLQLLLIPEAHIGPNDGRDPERLKAAAKLLRIDLAKVKVEEEAKPNATRPNKWQRRNKRGKAKHTPKTAGAAVATADVDDDDDGEGSGWDGTTREDLWDNPDDVDDDEDLDDEDLAGDELDEEDEPAEAAR